MKLQLHRHLWGIPDPGPDEFQRIAAAGYIGVQADLPASAQAHRGLLHQLNRHGLQYIPMIFTAGDSVREHVESFRREYLRAIRENPGGGRALVTCHSGRDRFTAGESAEFFAEALRIERDAGVPVAHETHRGRILYNPWITRALLERFDDLMLCCDFSHWVCVCERLIDEEMPTIELAARRCLHLHARVGYEQGPQVPDPSAPEYRRHLEAHDRWWDAVWGARCGCGAADLAVTPEFGPPPYLHTLPHTNMPVADLWTVCEWMADHLRARYGADAPKERD